MILIVIFLKIDFIFNYIKKWFIVLQDFILVNSNHFTVIIISILD